MKISTAILLYIVMHADASFFDDFRGAMSSVENAFGKLLNDVVTDVKSTMHCTILAMEQVLAMHGVIAEPINNKDCYPEDKANKLDIKADNENRNLYLTKDIAHEISASISKVNNSLTNVLDNEGHERLQDIRKEYKNESARLIEVSLLLRQELQKISQRMKKEFQNIQLDFSKTSLESVLNEMKVLYEVEKNDKNVNEVNEISEVFNEALNVLHVKTLSDVESDEDKIKVIMRELEKEPNVINAPNNKTNEQEKWEGERSTLQNNLDSKQMQNLTSNINNVVAKLTFENTTKNRVDEYVTNTSNNVVNNKLIKEKIQVAGNSTNKYNAEANDFSSFNEVNNEETFKGIDEAMDLLKESADTTKLWDNFFAEEHGVNVFENTNLFNFTK